MDESFGTKKADLDGAPLDLDGVPFKSLDLDGVPIKSIDVDGVPLKDVDLDGVPLSADSIDGTPSEYFEEFFKFCFLLVHCDYCEWICLTTTTVGICNCS